MAAGLDDRQQRRREAGGIQAITPETGVQILSLLMSEKRPQIGVFHADWPKFMEALDSEQAPPLLSNFASQKPKRIKELLLRDRIVAVAASRRKDAVADYVRERVIRIVGLDPAFPLDPHKPLREIGLDSLMVTELARALSAGLESTLAPTVVFTHSSIAALSEYLLNEVLSNGVDDMSAQQDPRNCDELTAEVQQLSDTELEAFLLESSATAGEGLL
jgi:hypothetical protein